MARRRYQSVNETANADLTSLMDVVFNIISFFVILSAMARFEEDDRVTLPPAVTAPLLDEDRLPNSFGINVRWQEPKPGMGKRAVLVISGLELDLTNEAHWTQLVNILKTDAAIEKGKMQKEQKDWKKNGLGTTIIMRVDENVDFQVFRRLIDECQKLGYRRFQYKARANVNG